MQSQTLPDPTTPPAEPSSRDSAFGLVTHGVALKLPIPMSISLSDGAMVLRLDNNNTDAVNQWAAFLGLPMPTRNSHVHDVDGGTPWCSFGHSGYPLMPALSGWHGQVWCLADATADEVAAARDAAGADR